VGMLLCYGNTLVLCCGNVVAGNATDIGKVFRPVRICLTPSGKFGKVAGAWGSDRIQHHDSPGEPVQYRGTHTQYCLPTVI
jgi:hypothetical protein